MKGVTELQRCITEGGSFPAEDALDLIIKESGVEEADLPMIEMAHVYNAINDLPMTFNNFESSAIASQNNVQTALGDFALKSLGLPTDLRSELFSSAADAIARNVYKHPKAVTADGMLEKRAEWDAEITEQGLDWKRHFEMLDKSLGLKVEKITSVNGVDDEGAKRPLSYTDIPKELAVGVVFGLIWAVGTIIDRKFPRKAK